MNVGTSVPLPAYTIDPAFMARKAEELGFESIWYAEHPAVPVEEIERLISERQEAKKRRDFAAADKIRKDLAERGIVLEDSSSGTRWKRR